MLKVSRYYIWYFYFCVYWSAYNWGEKRNPQDNATNSFRFIWILLFSIVLQIGLCFGFKLSGLLFFFLCAVPAFIVPDIVFSKKKINFNYKEFDFLRTDGYKRKRIIVVVLVVAVLIILNAGVAIYRNVTHSL